MTEFHSMLSKWMVNLLLFMVPDHTSRESLPLTDAEIKRREQRKLLDVFSLEGEAASLAVKMSKFSSYVLSCCKEMVSSITHKHMTNFDPDPEYEFKQLGKIQTECLDWIQTCNIILSGMKTTPTTLMSTEELIGLFGTEALQPKRQLPDRDLSPVESEQPPTERKEDEGWESGSKDTMPEKQTLETEVNFCNGTKREWFLFLSGLSPNPSLNYR
uniref:Uncharacterized protein n=1 Tax=Sphaerodactylus townsendi TaxID=933632 RepID=A0ACB8F3E1_9SAUR